jgi:histidinol phosphatase-like enzyme
MNLFMENDFKVLIVDKDKTINYDEQYLENIKVIDFNGAILSWNSWLAHSSHSNSYLLQQQLYERIIFNVLLKSA